MTGIPSNIGDGDLTVTNILRHGARWHAGRSLMTVGADDTRTLYGDVEGRVAALAHGLAELGVRPGEHGRLLAVEHPRARRGLLRRAGDGRPAAHDQPSAVAGPDRVHGQPRGRRGPDRRRVLPARSCWRSPAGCPPCARSWSWVRATRAPGPAPSSGTTTSWPAAPPTTPGRSSTSGPPPPCASRPARPATPRASPTATGPSGSTRSRSARRTRSRSAARDCGYIIVPMFHANAWGYPFANFWAGGDLLLSNRWVDPATVVEAVRTHRPTYSNGVPTVWNEILAYVDAEPGPRPRVPRPRRARWRTHPRDAEPRAP